MVNRVPPFFIIPKYEVFSKKCSLLIHLSQVVLLGFASYSTPCTSVSWPSLPPSPVIHSLDGKKTKTSPNIPSQAYSKPIFTQHTWIRMSQECLGGTVIGNSDWTYVEVIVGPILAPQFDDLLRVLSLKLQHDKGITWHQATHYPLKCNNATWEIEAQLKGFWRKALQNILIVVNVGFLEKV
jgi:hypothetical protein